MGFHHSSIPAGIAAIQKLGEEHNITIDTTTNADLFTYKNLKNYVAIIFLNTTGTIFNEAQREAVKSFLHKGKGIVGVHAAADTEYDWSWYNKMMGAWFASHPKQQMAKIIVKNNTHISTAHLPRVWERKDEWYNYKDISPNIQPLLLLDEKSYEGGKNGSFHPIAWYQYFEGGRVFYTGLGHTDESYAEPLFLKHLLGGIQFAMGIKSK